MFNRVFYNKDAEKSLYYRIIEDYFQTGEVKEYRSEKNLIKSLLCASNLQKHPSFKHECEIRITAEAEEVVGQCGIDMKIKYVGDQVKKVIILRPGSMRRCEHGFESIVKEVIIGPRSQQNPEVLKEYLRHNGFTGASEMVLCSECPLK